MKKEDEKRAKDEPVSSNTFQSPIETTKNDVIFKKQDIDSLFMETSQVRAGVEMALIDAVANSTGTPLWKFFGGVSNAITTDITLQFLSKKFELKFLCISFLSAS